MDDSDGLAIRRAAGLELENAADTFEAQGGRAEEQRVRFAGERLQPSRTHAGLSAAPRGDNRHWQPSRAVTQKAEQVERRSVGPLQVVDGDQQRLLRCEMGDQTRQRLDLIEARPGDARPGRSQSERGVGVGARGREQGSTSIAGEAR